MADSADIDTLVEQAWAKLSAKLSALTPESAPSQIAERQALVIIRGICTELLLASKALETLAETLKMQPNLQVHQRLGLANWTIIQSRRARDAAQSVLG